MQGFFQSLTEKSSIKSSSQKNYYNIYHKIQNTINKIQRHLQELIFYSISLRYLRGHEREPFLSCHVAFTHHTDMPSDGDGCLNKPALTQKNITTQGGQKKILSNKLTSQNQQHWVIIFKHTHRTSYCDLYIQEQCSCQGPSTKRGNASSVP